MNKKIFIVFSVLGVLWATMMVAIFQKSSLSLINSSQVSNNTLDHHTNTIQRNIDVRNRSRGRSYSYHTQRNSESFSHSYQEHRINIDLNSLGEKNNYFLTIRAATAKTQLAGEIYLNGQSIQQFKNAENIIDLSPYLTPGRQVILISGSYTPINDSVTVEFRGGTTEMTQTTGGNGQINQKLIIDVK